MRGMPLLCKFAIFIILACSVSAGADLSERDCDQILAVSRTQTVSAAQFKEADSIYRALAPSDQEFETLLKVGLESPYIYTRRKLGLGTEIADFSDTMSVSSLSEEVDKKFSWDNSARNDHCWFPFRNFRKCQSLRAPILGRKTIRVGLLIRSDERP